MTFEVKVRYTADVYITSLPEKSDSVLTFLTKMASGYWQMMNPQNGYTAIIGRALERVSLGSIYPGYGYCNEFLVEGDAPVAC